MLADWTGAVGVAYRGLTGYPRPEMITADVIRPAFEAAVEIVQLIGRSGNCYVEIVLGDSRDTWPGTALIGRGPIMLDPAALDLTSVEREINRTLGIDAPEPETPARLNDSVQVETRRTE